MTEVAQVPSSSNLPNTEDLPTEKRLYIGGLSSQLTSTEIEEKFSRFGKITKNLEISQKFQNSNSKFGFLNILINIKNWKNLLSTLNGSNWKGSKLKIQEAKPSNFERITNERVNVDSSDDKDKKTRKRIMFEHSKDFNLVNVDNYEANTHWKKLRFDKLIRSMKIRRPNGIILNYDPKNYQKNFKKFKNDDEVSEASLKGLNWEDVVTPEPSDSSDYDSSTDDDSSEDDSEESGDYESDENAVEGLFDDEDGVQDEELEGSEIEDEEEEEEYGIENTIQSINEFTDNNDEKTTQIEEPNLTQSLNPAQPPSIIQQLSAQEQPTQVEEVPVRPQTPEPAKPKSKIDLLIDSIINDGPEVPKQEPKKIFRRRVQKPQKAKPSTNNEKDEDQKPEEDQAPSSSFSFNFNF